MNPKFNNLNYLNNKIIKLINSHNFLKIQNKLLSHINLYKEYFLIKIINKLIKNKKINFYKRVAKFTINIFKLILENKQLNFLLCMVIQLLLNLLNEIELNKLLFFGLMILLLLKNKEIWNHNILQYLLKELFIFVLINKIKIVYIKFFYLLKHIVYLIGIANPLFLMFLDPFTFLKIIFHLKFINYGKENRKTLNLKNIEIFFKKILFIQGRHLLIHLLKLKKLFIRCKLFKIYQNFLNKLTKIINYKIFINN